MMPVASCIPFPFSALCDNMLTMLACATRWLYLHLYMLAYMSMHQSCLLVCHPCFNTMKLWTFDPNLHLSLVDTTFVFLLVCLLSCYACHVYHTNLFYAFSYTLCILPSIAYLLVSCLCLCMQTHGARTHGARARSPKCKQKGRRRKHVNKPSGCVQQVQEFSLSLWLCTLLNPFHPRPFLSQMGCIRYIMSCTICPYLQSMATLVYFRTPIFWAMLWGCRHLLSCSMCLHCALCMYIYTYLPFPV